MTAKQFNPTGLGLALGLLWAGGVAAIGILSRRGLATDIRELIGDIYVGYDETSRGILIGTLWAFGDALLGGMILGWLYNELARLT